jgi:hypothetical protein
VAGHGVQAAAKHRARQQVHDRLEAAGVDDGGIECNHDCNVDQVRRPCRGQAERESDQKPRDCTDSRTVSTSPTGTMVTKATHNRTAAVHNAEMQPPTAAILWTAQVDDGAQ